MKTITIMKWITVLAIASIIAAFVYRWALIDTFFSSVGIVVIIVITVEAIFAVVDRF